MGFERPDAFIDRGDVELDRAYQASVKYLQQHAVDPHQFESKYGKEEVEADLSYVRDREAKFSVESGNDLVQKYSTILEKVLYDEIELNEWMGKNVVTIRPSRYDDFRNGIDLVVEFQDPENPSAYLGVAVDVTLAKDQRDVQREIMLPQMSKRITRTKEELQRNRLPTLKYPPLPGQEGIPRVLAATDLETAKELTRLHQARDNRSLAEHPFQLRLLDEITLQLKAQLDYAEGVQNHKAVRVLSQLLAVVEKVQKTKEPLRKKHEAAGTLGEDRDQGYLALYQSLDEHFALAA